MEDLIRAIHEIGFRVDFIFLRNDDESEVDRKLDKVVETINNDNTRVFVTVAGGINAQKARDYINRKVKLVYGRSVPLKLTHIPRLHYIFWNNSAKVFEQGFNDFHTKKFWKSYFTRDFDKKCCICLGEDKDFWERHLCDFCSTMICARCIRLKYCPVCQKTEVFYNDGRDPEGNAENERVWDESYQKYLDEGGEPIFVP